MTETTRVDFHCHSTHSDGMLGPRELAQTLQADGVTVAALTDHDTTDGLVEFREALTRHGIGFISGVELTTRYRGEETHLLAYGVDPLHPGLQAAMLAQRQTQLPGVQSIAESLRVRGSARLAEGGIPPTRSADGGLDIAHAIQLVHEAGGKAFLAHPHMLGGDLDLFRSAFTELRAQGLDGIEAYYQSYSPAQQQMLIGLANELGLLISGGTDAHERRPGAANAFGVAMPTPVWKAFRDAVFSGGAARVGGLSPALPPVRRRPKWRHFIFHFIFPALLALTLFACLLYTSDAADE